MRFLCTAAMALFFALASTSASTSASTADDNKTRKWQDATGTFSLEAELVEVRAGSVRLKRTDGKIIDVPLDKLCSADQQYVASLKKDSTGASSLNVPLTQLTGKPKELKNDDGKAAGKKSFPRGIAAAFQASGDEFYLTSFRIHGGRYGMPRAPREDFHVTLCDKDFKQIADFDYQYSKFERGDPKWVTLRCKPTKVPRDFVICLNFKPERTKGVFVSHDKEGIGLVGLPGKSAGAYKGGDWLVRVSLDQLKPKK